MGVRVGARSIYTTGAGAGSTYTAGDGEGGALTLLVMWMGGSGTKEMLFRLALSLSGWIVA